MRHVTNSILPPSPGSGTTPATNPAGMGRIMTSPAHRDMDRLVLRRADMAAFSRSLTGAVVTPDNAAYETAKRVWNGMVERRPVMIAYCAGEDDVARTVAFAREHDMPLSVRAGGHNAAGLSVADGGIVADLSRMTGITVDPVARTVRAQAGLTLGAFDTATQAHALATTMGVASTTGIAGLTLGGGFGKLGRKHGLACDNLLAADVVTADGRMVRASESDNADLFWGLRGAGSNFGVVTMLEYRLHPLGPQTLRASLMFDTPRARDAMRVYRDVAAAAPDEISADAALARGPAGTPVFSVSLFYAGPAGEGSHALERVIEPLRAVGPAQEELGTASYLDIQSAADAVFPHGDRYYWKAHFLDRLDDGFIDALLDGFRAAPSPRSLFVFQQVGGAISRVAPDATAYTNRAAAFDSFPAAIWSRPDEDAANIAWVQELWQALRPFSSGGVYVNNLGEEGSERLRAAYGGNYARLAALKARYDPGNLFRFNQNIPPAQ